MSGVGTAIGIGAGVSAAGSLAGAAISANAAGNAASQQSAAATHAADLNYQASQNALGFQEGQFNTEQGELAPYLQSGTAGLSNLDYLLGVGQPSSTTPTGTPGATGAPSANGASPTGTMAAPAQTNASPGSSGMTPVASGTPGNLTPVPGSAPPGASGINPPPNLTSTPNTSLGGAGSLLAPYPGGQFTAPTAAQAEQTPGYQFQLQQGDQAVQQSAAARGNLLTGGTAEALDNYGQGLAASNYQNVYNNAYNTYASNYNQYQNQQTNTYNRLASLAGVGQQTASTLGTLGSNSANSISNNLLGTAAQIGQQTNNAAAATASGVVGAGNAWSGALSNTGSNLSQLAMLQSIMGGQSGSGQNVGNLWNAVSAGNQQPIGTVDPGYGGYIGG